MSAFGLTVVGGVVMGVVFDVFRVVRRGVGSRGPFGSALDILYWVAVTPPLLGLLWKANKGELRFYVLLGIGVGTLLYNAVASPWVVEGLAALWHAVVRALGWIVHTTVAVVAWPVVIVGRFGFGRSRRRARPRLRPSWRGWRPALAWRRR